MIKASELAKELGLYLKIVTSNKFFDTYNPFFNIFDEVEEPCRRILVLTPYKELEEVNDKNPADPIIEPMLIEGNIWLKEYPLTTNPRKINLDEIEITEEFYNKIKNMESGQTPLQ